MENLNLYLKSPKSVISSDTGMPNLDEQVEVEIQVENTTSWNDSTLDPIQLSPTTDVQESIEEKQSFARNKPHHRKREEHLQN